jgi:putative ABC transport system substrate-binding protein
MNAFSSKSLSDNLKSKTCGEYYRTIANSKWLGLSVIAFVLMVGGVAAQTQQAKKVPRLGYLSSGNADGESTRAEGIRLALRERGYIEGQNIAIEYRYAEGKPDRNSELVADLVRLKVEIIVVVGGGESIRAAKNATKTIPIVMAGTGGDPVKGGFVESLARPGGNVTGLSLLSNDLGGKRLELFKEAVPKLALVAVLYVSANVPSIIELKEELTPAARALQLTLQPWEVRGTDDLDRVFAALNKQRRDGST